MHNTPRTLWPILAVAVIASVALAADPPQRSPRAVPYPTLHPPQDITPADTRGWFPWDPEGVKFPARTWTADERRTYEEHVRWFHEAKYGLMFHFLAFGDRARDDHKNFRPAEADWTSDRWNQVVEAVDVERTADQAKELGAGYVVLTLGQNHKYSCAPNAMIDKLWNLKQGQYCARRDLPMDLGRALAKRSIALMLYIVATDEYQLPVPASWTDTDRDENWLKVVQWYSDHYGKLSRAWWVDGMTTVDPKHKEEGWRRDYPARFLQALKHGNPDTLVASGIYGMSDFLHGHCITGQWDRQRTRIKPFFGRWDPDFRLQWHVLQFVGTYWGSPDTPKQTADLVSYAGDVIRGGGVFTFDVGSYKSVNGKTEPSLDIPPAQMVQLRAVRDALKDIPPSDGSGAPHNGH